MLLACLDSLAVQTFSDFEVVVVDNGSTDGSVEYLSSLAFRRPLRLIENSENRGFCAANNQGFAAAEGEFFALLNNDAEADPGWLQAMYDAISLKPAVGESDVGMIASKVLVWENPATIDKCGHLIYPDGQNRGRGAGQTDRGQFDRMEEALWPDGCACLYRRAMLDEVGGFDEQFFAYADDAELGLRARIAGWNCLYAPGAVVRHHRGATLGLNSARRLTLIERNRVLLVAKLFPWNLLWLNGAYHLARIGAGAIAVARQQIRDPREHHLRERVEPGETRPEDPLRAASLIEVVVNQRGARVVSVPNRRCGDTKRERFFVAPGSEERGIAAQFGR